MSTHNTFTYTEGKLTKTAQKQTDLMLSVHKI